MDVSKEDQTKMMKLIDKNNNGYLSFQEFSKVFKPTMSEELVSVDQKDSYLPNLQPSKNKNNQMMDKQTKFVETVTDIKRSFEPNHENRKLQSLKIFSLLTQSIFTALKKATRFGAKPDFGSTFVNF